MEVIGKTDSRTLERAIREATGVGSGKLRIAISRIKEMVETGKVTEITWVSGKDQVADGLTKDGGKRVVERIYGRSGGGKKWG